MPPENFGATESNLTVDDLFAGDFPRVTDGIIVAAGNLARGTVLGRVTATGNYIAYLSGAADGSEVPRAILNSAVDATSEVRAASAYFSGHFKAEKLIGLDTEAARDSLRTLGIYATGPLPA